MQEKEQNFPLFQNSSESVLYKGSCHCKKVTFEFEGPSHLEIFKCNCSICWMKQNHHIIVAEAKFKLSSGENELQLYTFNTHIVTSSLYLHSKSKHYFCKICGVQPFYYPRTNPNNIAVTIYCVTLFPFTTVSYKTIDGFALLNK